MRNETISNHYLFQTSNSKQINLNFYIESCNDYLVCINELFEGWEVKPEVDQIKENRLFIPNLKSKLILISSNDYLIRYFIFFKDFQVSPTTSLTLLSVRGPTSYSLDIDEIINEIISIYRIKIPALNVIDCQSIVDQSRINLTLFNFQLSSRF